MGWIGTPRTWVTGEIVTGAKMNDEVHDRFVVLDQHIHSGDPGDGSLNARNGAIIFPMTVTRMSWARQR